MMDHSPKQSRADELELVAAIRAGDPHAWKLLIDLYEGRLQAFAYSRLSDRDLAQDVVQETMIGFLTSLPNYDESRTSIEAFLFRIAAYKITDVLRKKGRRPVLSGEDPASPDAKARKASSMLRSREGHETQRSQLVNALETMLSSWIEEGRYERIKCCELLFVRGLPNREVAAKLEITEQQVANHKRAFLQKLEGLNPAP